MAALVIIGIFYPSKSYGDPSEAVKDPYLTLSSLSDTADKDTIIMAIREVAKKYLIDESSLMQTIKCESGYQHAGVFGDWNGKEYLAYGLLQWHFDSFSELCSGSYYSAKDQLVCTAELWAKNPKYKKLWSCWSRYFGS